MFCPSCGKQVEDDSKFCRYCGKLLKAAPRPVRWEYKEFVYRWPEAGRPEAQAGMANGRAHFQNHFWREFQHEILVKLDRWLNEGWQPVSEVGPAALKVQEIERGLLGSVFGDKLSVEYELLAVHVSMKRPVYGENETGEGESQVNLNDAREKAVVRLAVTPKERLFLSMLVKGYSESKMADLLDMSESSLRFMNVELLDKFEAQTNKDLVRIAKASGYA